MTVRSLESWGGVLAAVLSVCWIGAAAPAAGEHDEGAVPPAYRTLEDFYGDTGETFQAAVGFVNFEGTAQVPAKKDYGLAIDDMFVEWREFTLEQDASDCADGSCATIELTATNVFDGNSSIGISLLEASPYGFACDDTGLVCFPRTEDVSEDRCPTGSCIAALNDCDLDGDFFGAGDDGDCDDDGTPDVVVKATSEAEVEGEIVVLNQTASGVQFAGQLTISYLGDTDPGILFVAEADSDNPTVTVTYLDYNDGTIPADICANDVDPQKRGFVQSATTVFLGETCNVLVAGAEFDDNKDHDRYPDTHETIEMSLLLFNDCGFDLHGCVARLTSTSPEVECIIDPFIDIPFLEDSGDVELTAERFVWKVADIQSTDFDDPLTADFTVTMSCDEIEALSVPQALSLPLDLDINDLGQTASPWLETFEGGAGGADLGGTAFEALNDDAGIPGANNSEGLINGDGYRCQYSDPDWVNSGPYGDEKSMDCFPGDTLAQSEAVFWQIDGPGAAIGSPDGGRAFTGSHSMYYGIFLTDPAGQFTTPMAVLESAGTTEPINLGVADDTGIVELSWGQQISLADNRAIYTLGATRSADRGVTHLQLADRLTGAPVGDWTKLEPFQNPYQQQANDNFFNCMFDPIDDGTTEDGFFDPNDPNRRLGPSSTCNPAGSWACQGDTDQDFIQSNTCLATTVPGPASHDLAHGTGTWVEAKVDLTEHSGRRVRLRFTATALKADFGSWQAQFMHNPLPDEDGWWIDDVRVNRTLETPALFEVDTRANTELPGCGEVCESVTANVVVTPPGTTNPSGVTLDAPGQVVELDAADSVASVCLDGTLQYRFENVTSGTELRGFSDNPVLLAAPSATTTYQVDVRCSTLASCLDSRMVEVGIDCPSTGAILAGECAAPDPPGTKCSTATQSTDCPLSGTCNPIFPEIFASGDVALDWGSSWDYEVWCGEICRLNPGGGDYLAGGICDSGTGSSYGDPSPPQTCTLGGGGPDGTYYLLRDPGPACNAGGLWTSGGSGEDPSREPTIPPAP